VWDTNGAALELGDLGTNSSGFTRSEAYEVDNAGRVGGYAKKYVSGFDRGTRAVRWDSTGAAVELGTLATDTNGFAENEVFEMNGAGQMVGASGANAAALRAVRWDPDSTIPIELGRISTVAGFLPDSKAYFINERGEAVGTAEKSQSDERAVYWRPDGSVLDLNDLIDPASGWLLTDARCITENGWIMGFGSFDPDGAGTQAAYQRLYIMQVPEPEALTLLVCGSVLFLRTRWARRRAETVNRS
jgi:hypothetical protein